MALNFDELNVLDDKQGKARSIPFNVYFGEMELSEEEKQKRIKMAYDFNDMLLWVFALIGAQVMFNSIDYLVIREQLETRYFDIIFSNQMVSDAYLKQYVADFVDDFIDTTFDDKNLEDSYYLSQDRAQFIAENESQTMNEYDEYIKAVKAGYRFKTWVTKNDKRVRKSHVKLEGKQVGIKELFNVGNVKMRFPKDYKYAGHSNEALREIINCRCHATYKK